MTQTTAWKIKHKLKQVMPEHDAAKPLSGRVEIDDAYLGGMHVFVSVVATTDAFERLPRDLQVELHRQRQSLPTLPTLPFDIPARHGVVDSRLFHKAHKTGSDRPLGEPERFGRHGTLQQAKDAPQRVWGSRAKRWALASGSSR